MSTMIDGDAVAAMRRSRGNADIENFATCIPNKQM